MSQSPDTSISRMEGCVMLALSTFRQSQKAIDTALEESRATRKLMIVYVVDMNLGRYVTDVDHGFIPEWKEIHESDLLQKHEKVGWNYVAAIAERAKEEGTDVNTHTALGRFALVCLDIVQRVKPSLIVTTRSKRPEWVRRFFGSPVDDLIAEAGCPVIVV